MQKLDYYGDFLGDCLDCGTQLTEENTYPKKKGANWRRCITCTDVRRNKKQKTCLWCGILLTEKNTYKGGPIAYSYCKKHTNATGRMKDFNSHVSIEETRPQKELGTCIDCGVSLSYENKAKRQGLRLTRCRECDAKYLAAVKSPTIHCLYCHTLITDSNRGANTSRLFPYCNLHLTLQDRREAEAEAGSIH